MKAIRNILTALVLVLVIYSFTHQPDVKVQLTNTNTSLQKDNFKLEEGTYLLNQTKFEEFYVTIKSNRTNGKEFDKSLNKRIKIKGTKYTLYFYEKFVYNGKTQKKTKTFLTVWDNGRIDKWNTEKPMNVDNYHFNIKILR